MGKGGKARKRQRIEREVLVIQGSITDDDDSGSDENEIVDTSCSLPDTCVESLVTVLDCLSQRLDLFETKKMKLLRVALYPLIEVQKSKFFENTLKIKRMEDEEFNRLVSQSAISKSLRAIQHYTQYADQFASESCKHVRRALHPLVVYAVKKSEKKGGVAPINSRVPHESSLHPHSNESERMDWSGLKGGSGGCGLSQKISNCFRTGDHEGALRSLREVRRVCLDPNTSDTERNSTLPKLGSLQRWVRDCDINALSAASGKSVEELKEMALLLLYAVLNVTDLLKQHSHVPTAAAGAENNSKTSHHRIRKEEYSKVVIKNYPIFAVPPVYSSNSYLSEASLAKLISAAAAASAECLSAITTNQVAPVAPVAPAALVAPAAASTHPGSVCCCLIPSVSVFANMVSVVSHVPGPQRRPPTTHDLNIFYTAPGTLRYDSSGSSSGGTYNSATTLGCVPLCAVHSKDEVSLPAPTRPFPVRHDVPHVPGAMLLTGILTPIECAQFLCAAERLGYTPDAVDGIDNVVWLADDSLLAPIYNRVKALLPQVLDGHVLMGINARLRLFRYYADAVYRPHIDGAWPGSGLLQDGSYTDDAFNGDRHSRLTFLIYLNDGFEGGTTTYFLAGSEQSSGEGNSVDGVEYGGKACDEGEGRIEVHRVKPQLGSVLVFPHGTSSGSLVHEGSAVTKGVKYVIRTDVLYSAQPQQQLP